jgi:hypothetical protein
MPSNSRIKTILALALAAIACVLPIVARWSACPRVNKSLYVQVGRTLAIEGLKLIKSGGKFTIIARDSEEYRQPAMALAVASLQREIRRAGAEIRSIESIQLDPIRPVEVASGDFYEVLRRCSAGDVIISLLGPPHLSEEHKTRLGRPKARIVALCPSTGRPEELLKSGWLDVALVNKSGGEAKSFQGLYTVLRAEPVRTSTASL